MKRREFVAAAMTGVGSVSGLTALAGCLDGPGRSLPHRPTGEWRQHAHDARNTGTADVTVPPRGTPAWNAGEAHVAAPLVSDGTVFSVSHEVSAVDARTGETRWRVDVEGKADHTPALVDDRLVVATDRELVALAREDGAERWRIPIPSQAVGAVTATTDPPLVTVPVADAGVLAYDHRRGERRWHAPLLGANRTAVAGATVYATGYASDGDTGVLRALAADDGTRRWETELGHPDIAPVVADDAVLVGDTGTLAVHDRVDGTRRRTFETDGERVTVTPAVADGTAFVASDDGTLAAVSVADATREWSVDAPVVVDTGVCVGRSAVVAPIRGRRGRAGPAVVALERADGSTRWAHPIAGFDATVTTPAVLADGAVFYASNHSTGIVALGDLPPRTDG